jgi:hypothetical protein
MKILIKESQYNLLLSEQVTWYDPRTWFGDGKKSSKCIKGNCENGQGTSNLENGSEYTGQWKDGKQNGEGTVKHKNGSEYTGQWKDGKINGQGTVKYKDGNVYVGQWKNNRFDGQGTFKFTTGAVYVGHFLDGQFHGQGTYTNPNGVKSSGFWWGGELKGKSFDDLDKIKQKGNKTGCVQPTKPTHKYKYDKNYQYAKSGNCWWVKNINNNKWFNLTELVKTKPNIQKSIDKLNDGTNLIKL